VRKNAGIGAEGNVSQLQCHGSNIVHHVIRLSLNHECYPTVDSRKYPALGCGFVQVTIRRGKVSQHKIL
jgi:hypothetical protein